MLYNDGFECRIYRPVAGTLNFLGEENTPMYNFLLSHTYPHNPRPGKEIANITEEELDRVLDGYTKSDSKLGNMRGAHDNRNKGKKKVLEHAKQSELSRERPKRD